MDNQAQRMDKQQALIRALAKGWEREQGTVQCFETHISWVIVAAAVAYKFKKAVQFDFLDFSTLEARRFYCLEELRLNRRLAPTLYLDVVAVHGDPAYPVIAEVGIADGQVLAPVPGPVLEYAVKMRAFDQEALWSRRVRMQRIAGSEVDDLARCIAEFHHRAERADSATPWGSPAGIFGIADGNLSTVASLADDESSRQAVLQIAQWEQAQRAALTHVFEQRKRAGYVREGHGDMHCANILTLNDRAQAFDCLEFNEAMRWIDVMNDIAFPVMDLNVLGRPDLATRLLDQYLQCTGDFSGLAVLRYYLLHRALVRCKVFMLRTSQEGGGSDAEQGQKYLSFALSCMQPVRPMILIMHGFSGSGKSTLAARLLEAIGAIRLRSDAERKRLYGLPLAAGRTGSAADDLYDPASIQHTYERLVLLAQEVVRSGYPVMVDATFLRADQRSLFRELAKTLQVPFLIIDVQASEATMRARLVSRAQLGQDPSDADCAVLDFQLANHEPLSAIEQQHTLDLNLDADLSVEAVAALGAQIQAKRAG